MQPALEQARGARVPAAALVALADLRREDGVDVLLDGEGAWVRWSEDVSGVIDRLLPVPGVEFYARRGPRWHRVGHALPNFGLPWERSAEPRPLHSVLFPAPILPMPPDPSPPDPARLTLAQDDRPRPSTALACPLAALWAWAEWQPSSRLARLRAAVADGVALVVGRPLPAVADGRRYWGDRVLAPIGSRPEPGLPSAALLRILGVGDDAIVFLEEDGAEVVPLGSFGRLTRAGLRLALAPEAPEP
ncbi:MAG TPA: hypothetical protein VG406_29040 [Isosphaeraceae bacterium]|jgi:hypothetical protein|nr:hypothetical protein [Isosphaeraceae bacterium]